MTCGPVLQNMEGVQVREAYPPAGTLSQHFFFFTSSGPEYSQSTKNCQLVSNIFFLKTVLN